MTPTPRHSDSPVTAVQSRYVPLHAVTQTILIRVTVTSVAFLRKRQRHRAFTAIGSYLHKKLTTPAGASPPHPPKWHGTGRPRPRIPPNGTAPGGLAPASPQNGGAPPLWPQMSRHHRRSGTVSVHGIQRHGRAHAGQGPRVSLATARARLCGRWRIPNTATLYFQAGTLTSLPRRRSRRPSRTTSSALSHSHPGVFDMLMPARS